MQLRDRPLPSYPTETEIEAERGNWAVGTDELSWRFHSWSAGQNGISISVAL